MLTQHDSAALLAPAAGDSTPTDLSKILERDQGLAVALTAARVAREEFVDVLTRELPIVVRAHVVDALRAVAGLEAVSEALSEGLVREPAPDGAE
jgi:hypothetical protein